jgi:Saxitoxin biosynthesis operon protein SxtJ
MRWSDISFDPSQRMLRQFAWLFLACFGGMALWQILVKDRHTLGLALAALAVSVGSLGLIRPAWLRYLFVGWMILAFPIGWTVSQIMLAIIFYGLFTPFGLVFRLVGRDSLRRSRQSNRASYWEPKPIPNDLKRYFKQF